MNCIFCKDPNISIITYRNFYCFSCISAQYYNDANELLVSSFYFSYNDNHYKIINRHDINTTVVCKTFDKTYRPIYNQYNDMTYKPIFTSDKLLNLTPQNYNTKINIILAFI